MSESLGDRRLVRCCFFVHLSNRKTHFENIVAICLISLDFVKFDFKVWTFDLLSRDGEKDVISVSELFQKYCKPL